MKTQSKKPADQSAKPERLLAFRPAPLLRAAILNWAEHQADKPTLSEAVGRLVEIGLASDSNGVQLKDGQKRRARKMAGDAIDDMIDGATTADDHAARKRLLINGPDEFSDVRVDRPKRPHATKLANK